MVRNMNQLTVHKEVIVKSLTIHALDEQLAAQIKRRAREQSLSMNELIKQILAEGLGIKVPAVPPHRDDFAGFCGTWKEKDAREFEARVADTQRIDPEDWK
jgi:hypothetical protein